MHTLTILALIIGGAIGVWYGFVDDIELAFLVGLIAWGTATVAIFRGNFNPPEDLPTDARLEARTAVFAVVIVGLLVLGAAGAWVGFVEDVKPAMLIALLAWGAATFAVFSGDAALTNRAAETLGLSTLVVGAMLAGAVGVWYGLVEDVELGFLAGIMLWGGATLTIFRGKIATN